MGANERKKVMFAAKIIGTFFVASLFLLHIRNYFSDRSDKITKFIIIMFPFSNIYVSAKSIVHSGFMDEEVKDIAINLVKKTFQT